MKNRILLVFLAVTLAVSMVLFSACPATPEETTTPPPTTGEPTTTPPVELAPYKLGFNLDLTGGVGYIGIPLKRGAEWQLEKINAAGGVNGRQLQAIYYDSKTDTAEAVKNTKRLIDVDKVVITMGYTSTEDSLACVDTCNNAHVVLFSSSPDIITGSPVEPWHFTTGGDQKIGSIPILVDNLVERGCTKIAYIYLNIVYGQLGRGIFEENMGEVGLTPVIIENYDWGTEDFTPQVTHIKSSGADGLLITGLVDDTVKIIKTVRDLGMDFPIVSDYAVCGPEFIELGGDYVEGILSTAPRTLVAPDLPADDPQKEICMEVYNWYTGNYGEMSVYCTHLVDQVNIVALALEHVDPNLDPTKDEDVVEIREQLRDGIEKVQGYMGQHGIFSYSPTKHVGLFEGCYPLLVVQDGEWRLYLEGYKPVTAYPTD
jgi:branched-chain amino acid transport system substrate-binding protein